jgi:hypothetical protein
MSDKAKFRLIRETTAERTIWYTREWDVLGQRWSYVFDSSSVDEAKARKIFESIINRTFHPKTEEIVEEKEAE